MELVGFVGCFPEVGFGNGDVATKCVFEWVHVGVCEVYFV